jgi:hypothetical protein
MRDGAKNTRQRTEAPPAELLYRIPSHDKNGCANIEKQLHQTK